MSEKEASVPEEVRAVQAPGGDELMAQALKMRQEAIEAQSNELRLGRLLIPYLEAELVQRRQEVKALGEQVKELTQRLAESEKTEEE